MTPDDARADLERRCPEFAAPIDVEAYRQKYILPAADAIRSQRERAETERLQRAVRDELNEEWLRFLQGFGQ